MAESALAAWSAQIERLDAAERAAERSLDRLHQIAAARLAPRVDTREGAGGVLRVFVRHEPCADAVHRDPGQGAAWALRVEGRVLPPLPPACLAPARGGVSGFEPKFTSFFEKIAVYLDFSEQPSRPPAWSSVVTWARPRHATGSVPLRTADGEVAREACDADGFVLKRALATVNTQQCVVRIVMWRRYPGGRERFDHPRRSRARPAHALQGGGAADGDRRRGARVRRVARPARPEDRRSIQCDSQLRSIFGVDKLSFFHLEVSNARAGRARAPSRAISTRGAVSLLDPQAHLMNHLSQPEPIVIDHTISLPPPTPSVGTTADPSPAATVDGAAAPSKSKKSSVDEKIVDIEVQIPPDAPARAACAALERAKRRRETDAPTLARIDARVETLETMCAKRLRHAEVRAHSKPRPFSRAPPHLSRDALTAPPVLRVLFADAVLGPEDDESPTTEAKQLKPEFLENADRATRRRAAHARFGRARPRVGRIRSQDGAPQHAAASPIAGRITKYGAWACGGRIPWPPI